MTSLISHISRRTFLRLFSAGAAGLSIGKSCLGGEIRAGLDIGTSSVCVAVGRSRPDGTLHILGIGEAPSLGITRYGVYKIKEAEVCVNEALALAEAASGVAIRRVVLGVVGTKITPYRDGHDWGGLCYTDGGDGVLQPVDITECQANPGTVIVAGAGDRIQAIRRCLVSAGVEIESSLLAPAATASITLDQEQRRQGALVIDVGEGTTDYAVYAGDRLVLADCFARGLQDMDFEESVGSTFRFIKRRLEAVSIRIPSLRCGVHLVGGGALQPKVGQAAREVFGLKTQTGLARGLRLPSGSGPLSPRHFAAVGLIHWHPQPPIHA